MVSVPRTRCPRRWRQNQTEGPGASGAGSGSSGLIPAMKMMKWITNRWDVTMRCVVLSCICNTEVDWTVEEANFILGSAVPGHPGLIRPWSMYVRVQLYTLLFLLMFLNVSGLFCVFCFVFEPGLETKHVSNRRDLNLLYMYPSAATANGPIFHLEIF